MALLESEHQRLNLEWRELEQEAQTAHQEFLTLLARPTAEIRKGDLETLNNRLDSIHERQRGVIDRQAEVEQAIVRLFEATQ